MKKLKRMLLLAIVACAFAASIVTATVTSCVSSHALPSVVTRQYLPLGDPIDGPGPPGVKRSPQPS